MEYTIPIVFGEVVIVSCLFFSTPKPYDNCRHPEHGQLRTIELLLPGATVIVLDNDPIIGRPPMEKANSELKVSRWGASISR